MDIPTIDLAPLEPHDPASSLWNNKKNTAARYNMAYEAFNALYKHQIQPKKVLSCRPVITSCQLPAVKSAVILAPWKNKYNPPHTYTSAVSATEHTIGYALKVWAAIQMINGLAS